jgi:hypothetical protein
MSVDDTDLRLSAGTCPPDSYNTGKDYFPMEGGSVTGSRDSLTGTGRHQNDYNDSGGGGVNAYDFTFTGRFDNDEQISGSLTVARTVTWRAVGGGSGIGRGTVTMQVVLGKQ